MAYKNLKAMTRTRDPKFGTFIVEFATPGIGHMLKNAGCDFVFFDLEHSGFSYETMKSAVRYFEAAGVSVMVRVPSQEYHHIARALDVGAEGLICPMVSTPEQAKKILDCVRYYPKGQRGVAIGIPYDNYRSGPPAEMLSKANKRTTFICLIETAEGVENIDAIAKLDGVDCLWVGHFDLSWSLGIPGEFSNPKFTKAMDTITAAAKRHNKSLGRLVPNVEQGITFNKQGFDFICYSGDVWIFQQALGDAVGKLRESCKGGK
jgi:2-keto-3-deoxy-L-rhamnonate aldolase RhmA